MLGKARTSLYLRVISLLGTLYEEILTCKHLQDAYVNHLKEDKLRALGVDEQALTTSSALSVMSREVSSQSSAVLASSALASSSDVGPFPPSFYGAANSASFVGKPRISHFPTFSIAHPLGEFSRVSPSQLIPAPEPRIPGTWSPQTHFASQQGSRITSPQLSGRMHSAAPSVSTVETGNVGPVTNQTSIDLLARMRKQQALLQMQQLQQQQDLHLQPHQDQELRQRSLPSLGSFQDVEQILQPVTRQNQADIGVPVPRKHRQNPSEILQKGVDDARPYVSYFMDGYEGGDPTTQGYSKYQGMDTFRSDAGAAPPNPRAKGSTLDAGRDVKDVADHEANHRGQSQNKVSSKFSQLNVNAPNFEPRIIRNPRIFSFLGNKQAHEEVERESLNFPSADATMQATNGASQASKWNVAAPAFKPATPVMTIIPPRDFSFSALRPSLRPDAPEFEPSESRDASGLTGEQNPGPLTKKIFGDINFSEAIKPSRSEAISITPPNKESKSKSRSDEYMGGQEDESGRITQADGRQKRMRYVDPHICPQSRAYTLGVVL